MSEKSKGLVQVVLEKKKKDGSPYYSIIIDGTEYYDSKGNFKDQKDKEIEFEWSLSQDGNIRFINPVGGGFKGGGSRGKSPEEIALQKKAFALSYSKDQVNAIIASSAHLMTALPEGVKYLEFLGLMREAALKMTQDTAVEFLKVME
jgi:hypothetical protein